MKITISGSLGSTGKALTKLLVEAGHTVTVISSKSERKPAIESMGAKAAIGTVSDADFLLKAISGADAVFAMTPPALGGSNIVANITNAGKAFAEAFRKAGTPRVVMLSSIGADQPSGSGPIASVHNIEKIYSEVEGTSFIFLRAGLYYRNFLSNIPMIKAMHMIGANYPADIKLPLAHQDDNARAAADALQSSFTGKKVLYAVSDVRTPGEIAKVLGTAVGEPGLPWVEFTDEQSIQGMLQAGMPEEIAKLYAEMGAGFRSGKLREEFERSGSPVSGKVKLEDFSKEFAAAYK